MVHRWTPKRWIGGVFVLLGAGCSAASTLTPHTVLQGTWASSDMVIVATDTGVSLRQPCIGARFRPITLDDTLGFTASGVVTYATGLVLVTVGSPWTLSGHASGNRLVVRSDLVGTETLAPGTARTVTCNM